MIKPVKIFLASSNELADVRKDFRLFIAEKFGKTEKGISFETVVWENQSEAMSLTRSQDEYDEKIAECEIFVMLYHTKVGKYSLEEYETAYDLFIKEKKPRKIFIYKKTTPYLPGSHDDSMSLIEFEKILNEKEHFKGHFDVFSELQNAFTSELRYLLNSNYFSKYQDEDNVRRPCVYISFRQSDGETCEQITDYLKENEVDVITSFNMKIGDNIESFINKGIQEADVIISIVSKKSLLSSWVGMEIMTALRREHYGRKRYIACVIDTDFFDPNFLISVINIVDERLREIDDIIIDCLGKNLGIEHVQNERTRYRELRSNLPRIIDNLKNNLSVDVSPGNFENGMNSVLSFIEGFRL